MCFPELQAAGKHIYLFLTSLYMRSTTIPTVTPQMRAPVWVTVILQKSSASMIITSMTHIIKVAKI